MADCSRRIPSDSFPFPDFPDSPRIRGIIGRRRSAGKNVWETSCEQEFAASIFFLTVLRIGFDRMDTLSCRPVRQSVHHAVSFLLVLLCPFPIQQKRYSRTVSKISETVPRRERVGRSAVFRLFALLIQPLPNIHSQRSRGGFAYSRRNFPTCQRNRHGTRALSHSADTGRCLPHTGL